MAGPALRLPEALDANRSRAETLLAGEKRLLEMIARGEPLSGTLDALCELVEATAPASICSILLLDQKAGRLRHGGGPSLPHSFISQFGSRPIGPNEGPCAVAAYCRTTVIVADFLEATVPEWYLERVTTHGLRACWSVPVISQDGTVLGTFAVYYREPRSPSARELETIDQFRHLASIAIERIQALEALRRSEASLAEAQRLSRTGSFFWRPATGEIRWSNETYRIYRLDPAELPTFAYVDRVLHPEDVGSFRAVVELAGRDGGNLAFEHRLLFPDQTVTHLQVVAHAERDPNGGLEYVGAVMDVTERRTAEDVMYRMQSELAQVSRVTTLGQMTASIAHEINQPLAAIVINGKACLNWLGGPSPNLTEARDAVLRIVRDGQRAGDVISRLRTLFKGPGSAATREMLDLEQVVGEVATICRRDVERHGATLRIESVAALPPISGDRVQLQQVLLNLIQNGAEATGGVMERAKEVVVTTRLSSAGEVEIAVSDTGIGLRADQARQVFEAFYTTKSGGMGMGLAISRSIAENHGGRLWIDPSSEPGATFVLSLPQPG